MLPAQEFSFPDAVRLWDTLFSDPAGRTDCLLRICVAMLINVRTELLQVLFQPSIIAMAQHAVTSLPCTALCRSHVVCRLWKC